MEVYTAREASLMGGERREGVGRSLTGYDAQYGKKLVAPGKFTAKVFKLDLSLPKPLALSETTSTMCGAGPVRWSSAVLDPYSTKNSRGYSSITLVYLTVSADYFMTSLDGLQRGNKTFSSKDDTRFWDFTMSP